MTMVLRASLRATSTVGCAGMLMAFALPGCAAPRRGGEIPTGEWAGEGSFVYEVWSDKKLEPKAPPGPHSVHREYPTTLRLQRGMLDGQPVIEMDIRSQRGRFVEGDDLGEETHLKAALIEARRVSENTVLYRLMGPLFNPRSEEMIKFDQSAPPYAATCTDTDGASILQIHYGENFVDVFRFRGSSVEKTGMYFSPEEGMIHWTERLKRVE